MPEVARLRGREQGKEEGRALTKECIDEMLKNTRRITKDREGLSVSEEVNYVGADGEYYDQLSGNWLDPQLVKRAREEEMTEFRKHGCMSRCR